MRRVVKLVAPPSTNALWANKTFGKGRLRSESYKMWIKEAGYQMNMQGLKHLYPCSVALELYPSRRAVRDLDGYIKAVIDLLVTHHIIIDDSGDHVESIVTRWHDYDSDLFLMAIEPGAKICYPLGEDFALDAVSRPMR